MISTMNVPRTHDTRIAGPEFHLPRACESLPLPLLFFLLLLSHAPSSCLPIDDVCPRRWRHWQARIPLQLLPWPAKMRWPSPGSLAHGSIPVKVARHIDIANPSQIRWKENFSCLNPIMSKIAPRASRCGVCPILRASPSTTISRNSTLSGPLIAGLGC